MKATIWWLNKSHSNEKLLGQITFSNITWNKNHSSKLVASITYTPEKHFFAATTFEGLQVVYRLGQIEKLEVYFGLYKSSLLL